MERQSSSNPSAAATRKFGDFVTGQSKAVMAASVGVASKTERIECWLALVELAAGLTARRACQGSEEVGKSGV